MRELNTFVFFLLHFHAIERTCGDVSVSTRMIRYNNPTSTEYQGNYCDAVCLSSCDNYFTVCLGDVGKKNCRLAFQTGEFPTDNLTFPSNLRNGISNPHIQVIRGPYHGRLSIKVQVWDKDFVDADDLVDLYEANATIPSNIPANYHKETLITLQGKHTKLTLGVTILCDEGFYGKRCDIYCVPQDSKNGHYTCEATTGAKLCHHGWVGPNCTEPFHPCKHSKNYDGSGRTINAKASRSGPFKHDHLLPNAWYRIAGARHGVLEQMFAPQYSCGTKSPLFLPKKRPIDVNKEVDADICMSTRYSVCHMRMTVQMMACKSSDSELFYVYKLKPSPNEESGYCVA